MLSPGALRRELDVNISLDIGQQRQSGQRQSPKPAKSPQAKATTTPTNPPKPKLITTRSAARSRYFLGAVEAYSRPPILSSSSNLIRGPLDSYLNSPTKENLRASSPALSEDR